MKKLFVVGIVTLFVGMTIYPCINAGFLKIETRKINDSICDATSWRYLPFITENPYIIEGFNLWGNPLARWISVLHNTGETLIYISGTEKHVIIRNNYIHHSRFSGITIKNAKNVVIENNVIKYNHIGIFCDADIVIRHNDISWNKERGIHIYKPVNPVIEYNIISYNGHTARLPLKEGCGIWCRNFQDGSQPHPKIRHNNIFGSADFGICFWIREGTEASNIDAAYNWWGSADGPGGVGPGKGDKVTKYTNFEPWLTEPEADAGPQ